MGNFGLLGYPLGHSFSKAWFEKRGHSYTNFAYQSVEEFLNSKPSDLEGFNVTIPHKRAIIPFLDSLDSAAKEVGAVNCVKVLDNKQLKGYNTDIIGFEESLIDLIGEQFTGRAAVLGSGGASHAVCYVLRKLGIDHQVISRQNNGYSTFRIQDFRLIINATPLGMSPKVDTAPEIDYDQINCSYFLYDLVYNPAQTLFLEKGRKHGAAVKNGLAMLISQAQAALLIFEARDRQDECKSQ
ncbi:MAG: shikimate dehydrogenase [Mucinivorans sp.]